MHSHCGIEIQWILSWWWLCVPLPETTRVTAVPIGDVGTVVGAEEMRLAVSEAWRP